MKTLHVCCSICRKPCSEEYTEIGQQQFCPACYRTFEAKEQRKRQQAADKHWKKIEKEWRLRVFGEES